MQRLAQTPPDTWPMTATYQGLYGRFHPCVGLELGNFYQSRSSGIVSQAMTDKDKGHFAILRAISPTAERKRYTAEDRDRFVEEIADTVVAPGVRFQDLWELTIKETAVMVNQEEGYCDSGRRRTQGHVCHGPGR